MRTELILANIVKKQSRAKPDLNVLTVVDINQEGSFIEKTRNYKQLWDNGQAVAYSLLYAGMEVADRFGIFMHNDVEFVDAMVGSSIAGSVFVPIDPRSKGSELSYMLDFTDCRGVVVSEDCLPSLLSVITDTPQLKWIWVVNTQEYFDLAIAGDIKVSRFEDALKQQSTELPIAVNDAAKPMQMLFTSGTTGDPKAILIPYTRMATAELAYQLFNLNGYDKSYTSLSLTHANAQFLTLGMSLINAIPCVVSRRFTKSRLWDISRAYGCTVLNLLGGMTNAIYSEPPKANDHHNPIRVVISAGMPKAIWDAFSDRFNVDILEFYGAAEGGLTVNPAGIGPIGSIGKPPASFDATIVDENNRQCAVGESGEIVFKNTDGSPPKLEYFKNPEATAYKIGDGYLRMGDVGYKDKDGWLYFLFRKGGGIRKNGEFISLGFLEKVLAESGQVSDVFVYGVSTKNTPPGEKEIVAAIVPKGGIDLSIAELFQRCRSSLEACHVPDYVQLISEIPKTASEKPQERLLIEDFLDNTANVYARVSF